MRTGEHTHHFSVIHVIYVKFQKEDRPQTWA